MNPTKLIAGGVAAVCAIIFFLMTYFTVDQYERAVVTRWGEISYVAAPGLHFKMPFMHNVTTYRVDIRNVRPKEGVNTYTVDNQEVDVIFNLFYRLPPDQIAFIYQNAQDYHDRLFNMAVDRLKSEMGKVNASHVAQKRGELREAIEKVLRHDAKVLGVEITDFQLTNIEYTKSFKEAVEAAAAAKAGVETREQEKQQAMRRAETAKITAEGAANATREKAKGDADARLLQAKAEAEAIRLQGEAHAAAIRAQAEALKQNASLVELRKAERWDGKLPSQMLGGAPIPFMNIPMQAAVK